MANLSTIRKTLDDLLIANWNKELIRWDNVPKALVEDFEWIRPTLTIDSSENVNIGALNSSRIRHEGSYIIQVFTPLTKGTGDIYRAIDALTKLFNNKKLEENIFTYACQIDRVGDEGNGWYQVNVSVPFTADQLADD